MNKALRVYSIIVWHTYEALKTWLSSSGIISCRNTSAYIDSLNIAVQSNPYCIQHEAKECWTLFRQWAHMYRGRRLFVGWPQDIANNLYHECIAFYCAMSFPPRVSEMQLCIILCILPLGHTLVPFAVCFKYNQCVVLFCLFFLLMGMLLWVC